MQQKSTALNAKITFKCCACNYHKETNAMVIKAFDGEIYCCIGEQVYALEVLPQHMLFSKACDLAELPATPKKKYIHPMSHPWKQASFERYMKKLIIVFFK